MHALVVGTPISAPFIFVAVQAPVVLAATRHRADAVVLALLCLHVRHVLQKLGLRDRVQAVALAYEAGLV